MSSFRRLEKILLIAGALLALTSLWLILYRSDQFMAWLGYSSGARMQVAGKVEKHQNMIRRRFHHSGEFLPIEDEQTLYSRDTVMTGNESGMVIVLNDGSLIELGPDTLIEIRLKDEAAGLAGSEFMIHLQKGNVSGKSTSKNILVSQDNAITPLTPLNGEGIAAKLLAEPLQSKVAPKPCVISSLSANSPFENPNHVAVVVGEVTCESMQPTYPLSVLNEKGEKVMEKTLELNPEKPTRFEIAIPAPGNYQVGKQTIEVPKDYVGIQWKANPLRCDRLLDFEVNAKGISKKDQIKISEEGKTSLLSETEWKKQAKLPAKIRMVFETENHFRLISDEASISTWRDCPTLKNPLNTSVFSKNVGTLLFTWIQTDGTTYRFELSNDPLFKTHIKNEKTSHNFARFQPTQKGLYYWRVQSRKTGDLSDVFQFEVR